MLAHLWPLGKTVGFTCGEDIQNTEVRWKRQEDIAEPTAAGVGKQVVIVNKLTVTFRWCRR